MLKEHSPSADGMTPGAILNWDTEAFLLWAHDPMALADRTRRLREQLAGQDRFSLKDLAFTVNSARPEADHHARLGLVASSREELVRHLAAIEPRLRDPAGGRFATPTGCTTGPSRWDANRDAGVPVSRAKDRSTRACWPTCPHFPELRAVLDPADRIARESGEAVPPSHHLFAAQDSIAGGSRATDTAVTAVLASQWALFQVLTRLGLRPDAVAGHSSGELPATAAAGAVADRGYTRTAIEPARGGFPGSGSARRPSPRRGWSPPEPIGHKSRRRAGQPGRRSWSRSTIARTRL